MKVATEWSIQMRRDASKLGEGDARIGRQAIELRGSLVGCLKREYGETFVPSHVNSVGIVSPDAKAGLVS